MKEKLEQLRQSRCLPYLAILLSFLTAWTGETGSAVWGGLCVLLSLPLLIVPEYLLLPMFTAVLLDNNCSILPGVTASRYFTLLFLAAQGITVLVRERPKQLVRSFYYPVLLVLYLFVSAALVGHCFSLDVLTLGMNIALVALMGSLSGKHCADVWRLLPWSAAAAISYMLFCLNFREVEVINGRYWFLGATNVNDIGMVLAQIAMVFFTGMAYWSVGRRGEWKSFGCFAGYVLSLYLLVLTGSRSALLGLVVGCAVLSVLLLLRSEKGKLRYRQTANLAVTCCLSAVLCLTAPQLQQHVEFWRYDASHPAEPIEDIQPETPNTPVDPEQPGAPSEIDPEQPEEPMPLPPTREETAEQLQENTDSFWRRMNPFSAYWGKSAGRTEIWNILMEYSIKPHPLVGTGYGSAAGVLHAHGDSHSGAHNILIAVLSDLGLIGLLLHAVPLCRILCRLLRRKEPAALLPLGMLVTALVNGIGENIYTERFLWVAVGLALWLLNCTASSTSERTSDDESPVCHPVSVQ